MWFLVVFFLVGGVWIQGDPEIWKPVSFTENKICEFAKDKEMRINDNLRANNPRLPEMKFVCMRGPR